MSFRKAGAKKIGGKFLVYGFTGSGKSYFGCTFPKVGAVDSETGLAFYEGEDLQIGDTTYNNLQFVDTTSDLDDLEEDLDSVIDGETEIDTFLVDSETKFYNTMDIGATEAEERKAKQNGKNVDNRAKWGRVKNINMKLQQAKISASSQGIHVVSTAQGSDITDDNSKVIGHKPDVHKSLKFDYDVVLWFYSEENKKTGEIKYFAQVEKDRTHVTKVGDIIENCTYNTWKSYFDRRNGLETSGANFSKDLKNSTQSVLNNAELSEVLAKEVKEKIKSHSNSDNKDKIKDKIKELQIDIKNIDLSDPETLKTLITFIDSLN